MIIVWIVLGLAGLLAALFILGWLNAIRASMTRNRQLDEMIMPAIEAVEAGDSSAAEIVGDLAALPQTRNHLYAKLKDLGKDDLFPSAFRSVEKVAESDLVRWLMHRNELDAVPSDIEPVRTIPVEEEEKRGTVILFRFRIEPPHWASDKGWMAGIAGPYWDQEEPPDSASGTFSEFAAFHSMTMDEHVEHLRRALYKRGLVVPS